MKTVAENEIECKSQIRRFSKNLLPLSQSFIAYARQSPHTTHANKLLRQQLDCCRGSGGKIIAEFTEIQYRSRYTPFDRPQLLKAVELARRTHSIVLIQDRTRLCGSGQHKVPSKETLSDCLKYYKGVKFMCLWGDGKVKSNRTKKGHEVSGNRGGRERMETLKERRGRLEKKVVEMRKRDISWGEISKVTNVHRATLQYWVRMRCMKTNGNK